MVPVVAEAEELLGDQELLIKDMQAELLLRHRPIFRVLVAAVLVALLPEQVFLLLPVLLIPLQLAAEVPEELQAIRVRMVLIVASAEVDLQR